MPYILNKTNGSVLATVGDGSINQSTDLTFVGKNYAGYGEFINENLLKLLENFSNGTKPSKPITGQLWYDSKNRKLNVYNGSSFLSVAYTSDSSNGAAPTNLTKGDFWFDESQNVLNVFTGTRWLPVGPAASSTLGNVNSVVTSIVKDDGGNDRIVAKHIIDDVVQAVTSSEDFSVNESESIQANFPTLRKGITLSNANTGGRSANGTNFGDGYYLWGTAANALTLGVEEYTVDDFLLKDTYEAGLLNGLVVNTDSGILVGTGGVFKFWANAGNQQGIITAVNGTQISFELQRNNTTTNVLNLLGDQILPGYNTPIDIGRSTNRFARLFVNTVTCTTLSSTSISATTGDFTTVSGTFSGNITGNVTGNVTGNTTGVHVGNVQTTNITSGSPSTIGTITGNWSINPGSNLLVRSNQITTGADATPGTIQGKWTLVGSSTLQATYADLAERYAADAHYGYGIVLVIGGEKEVTVTTERASIAVAGIVSEKPAYMLNCDAGNDETHPYIALKGRVMCRVVGTVRKGELLVTSAESGFAEAWRPGDDPNAVIGKALESIEGPFGLIEVKV